MNTQPITDIMTHQVRFIDIDEDLTVAKEIMSTYEIHHLPVLENKKLVGMLSWNDIRRVEFLLDFIGQKLNERTVFKALSVEEMMTSDLQSLTTDATIAEAVQVFSNASFQSLPITENGELVGIVTTKDVFSSFLVEG